MLFPVTMPSAGLAQAAALVLQPGGRHRHGEQHRLSALPGMRDRPRILQHRQGVDLRPGRRPQQAGHHHPGLQHL